MQGLMMDIPLTITSIMRHAERVHGAQEIVSVTRITRVIDTPMPTRLRVLESSPMQ